MNSRSSLEEQQLGEISQEGNHYPIHPSPGAETKASPASILNPSPSKIPCFIMYYEKCQFEAEKGAQMGQAWLLGETLANAAVAFFLIPDSGDSDSLPSTSTG